MVTPGEVYPALTLWQPWATLVAEGLKPFEFRSWRPSFGFVGQRVAIHAGSRPCPRLEIGYLCARLRAFDKSLGVDREPALKLLDALYLDPKSLPLKSVLCMATLGEPIRGHELAARLGLPERSTGRRDDGNWGWPLSDIVRLQPPLPATGRQGVWRWTVPGAEADELG